MLHPKKTFFSPLSVLIPLSVCAIGYGAEQDQFLYFFLFWMVLFGSYLYVVFEIEDKTILWRYILLGIFLRLILIPPLPGLSDDLYRFIWDGQLILNGINPFEALPQELIKWDQLPAGITEGLFEQLNSQDKFTIYPPIAQFTFLTGVWLFPESIQGASMVMKTFLFLFEIGTIWLLWQICLYHQWNPYKRVVLYALNPLLMIEGVGNVHFEPGMIFFLILGYYLLLEQKWKTSAIAMAASVASKLLPLLFFPFIIRRLGWRKSFLYFSIVGVVLAILFAPLVNGVFLTHFGDSLDLYFRKFEFNASLYYVLRWIGYQVSGYNLIAYIGPSLGLIAATGIMTLAWFEKKPNLQNLPQIWLWAICLYLLCTTTVHPWYASLPIVLCIFTPFRFPIIWSGLIALTYINYSYESYHENLWMVALEYLIVGYYLIFEVRKKGFFPAS